MMNRFLLATLIALIPIAASSAQLVEMVFGPLEGDNAGILYADTSQTIEVDLWIKTAPGISIVGLHIPLSTKDIYIRADSREGGQLCDQLQSWDDVSFLWPNADPIHNGYTNQSLLGVCCIGLPSYGDGIHTEGEWTWMASFSMTTTPVPPLGIPLCDALIEGYESQTGNGDITLDDYDTGELDRSNILLSFACLKIQGPSCGYYLAGDFNGSGEFNVADIVDSFSNLKTGSPEAAFLCECPPNSGNEWAVAMDVNGSCSFNVADIVTGFSYLKTGFPEPIPCGICPPGEP